MPTDRPNAASQWKTLTTQTKKTGVHAADASAVPLRLGTALRECARTCLSAYLSQGWSCFEETAECYCSQYSSQGFTIGELAYICLQQACGSTTHDDAVAAYRICSSLERAVPATHSTLTIPPKPTPTSSPTAASVSTGDSTPAETVSPTTTLHSRTSMVETPKSVSTSESGTAAATVSSTVSASPQAAGDQRPAAHPTSLSTAQTIGISVACVSGVVLALGVFYLIFYLRRRKANAGDGKRHHHSYDFVDEASPRFSPFHVGYADPRGPLGGLHGQRAELPIVSEGKERSRWHNDQLFPLPDGKFDKRFDCSPRSVQSHSTISQLLPDKPKATPQQIRAKQVPRPTSSATVPTVFEEDRSPQMLSAMFPPPVGLPSNPKAFHYPNIAKPSQARYADQLTHSPASIRHPSLSIEIPKQALRVVESPMTAQMVAPPLEQRSPTQRGRRTSEARSSRSAASFLNYYASPEADVLRSPDSPTPIDDSAQTRRAVPTAITVTKPTYPPRAVRSSGASDTSFESTDPDEPTPPDEGDKQLTPVKEHSPIAGIRYPKVPRSSNQAIPRSPPLFMQKPPTNIFHSPKQVRRPNALPVGAHATHSPRRGQDQSAQPRPTSQIVRKPLPSHQPGKQPITPERQAKPRDTLSGSTLAAKRRGDSAANRLEHSLYISNSAYSSHTSSKSSVEKPLPAVTQAAKRSPHNSPLKGYGRVASRTNSPNATRHSGLPQSQQRQAQGRFPIRPAEGTSGYRQSGPTQRTYSEEPLKSPLWEPKLTPSRKGEDLYLQVGSVTPRTDTFGWVNAGYRGR